MNKSLEWINYQIVTLEDSLQHYTMVEPDKIKEAYIKHDLECLYKIKEELKAWYIVRPDFVLQWEKPNDASGYYLKYFGDYEYETIKKGMDN